MIFTCYIVTVYLIFLKWGTGISVEIKLHNFLHGVQSTIHSHKGKYNLWRTLPTNITINNFVQSINKQVILDYGGFNVYPL